MKKISNIDRRQMAEMIAAFGGTFTGVFSALLIASCPPEYAARKANQVAEEVDADFSDPSGVVTPISIEETPEWALVVSYSSRSGKIYVFRFASAWHGNEIEFDEESSLAEQFEKVSASVENPPLER